MCGIAGIYNYKTGSPISHDTLKRMSNAIVHRGPDDEGYYLRDNIGLAFRRLSIIDLNTGNQPVHNEDRSMQVVFNGEIYNYVELREHLISKGHTFYTRTDTEVIVHLYEEYGTDFTLYLNGMYAIALLDENKNSLILVRDRVGIKPLYYSETNAGLAFASEIKSLLRAGVSNAPDQEAINQYLSYGFIPSPLTGFKAIRKLEPGHILICSGNSYNIHQFWDLDNTSETYDGLSEDDMADLLIDELTSVIKRQTRSDVPVGIFLSGGIDSSLVASVAAERCNLKLNAFTIGFKEESYNELSSAKIITDRLGLDLFEFILSENEIKQEIEHIMSFIDEPLFDYSAIPVYFVSKLARSKVKTVIGGEGGDELFGGYQTHYLSRIAQLYRTIPHIVRNGISSAVNRLPESHSYLSTAYKLKRFTYGADFPYDQGHYRWKVLFDEEHKKQLLSNDFLNDVGELDSYSAMGRYFNAARAKGYSVQEQLMYVDFKTFLQDDPLQKTDRMSMANSLEVRVPLLDNDIINFSRKVPLNKKIKGLQSKYLLRKALSRFQPPEIAFAKKRGFTPPLALWIKHGLKDYMMSSLSRESLSKVGFLDHTYIASIIDDHLNKKAENSRQIWALIVLVNWYRKYVSA
ncbi:MAG: asparagine synthase (glutamine-hydrolyzing) [Nitrospirota bacterium]|nr:asparagine synthase (glutamine-hydrolyzing) [Nitrospirota bacterium]